MRTILYSVLVLLGAVAYGQSTFHHTYGNPSSDQAFAATELDGSFVIVGGRWYWYGGLGAADMTILKLDTASGYPIWGKRYGGSSNEGTYELVMEPGQRYVQVGYTQSYGAGGLDAFVVITDTAGTVLVSKTYGGNLEDMFLGATKPSIGGYIFVGYTKSFTGTEDVYVIRTDANGDTIWTRTYGTINGQERGVEIEEVSPNRYVIVGRTNGWGSGNYDALVIMIDSLGNPIWEYAYGTTAEEHASDVLVLGPNQILILGSGWGGGTVGSWDWWLMDIDTLGTIIGNVVSYGSVNVDRTSPGSHTDMIQTSDGGFAIVGETNVTGNFGNYDAVLLKLTPTRTIQFVRVYGGGGTEQFRDVIERPTGGFILSGYTNSMGSGNWDMYIVGTKADGVADNCRDADITASYGTRNLSFFRTPKPTCP
ncbi:MAG: hypothetical protein GXO48_01855 [Chlorobi bacterium]|nr:hypothetical protein [Chlorobiota bacterium]